MPRGAKPSTTPGLCPTCGRAKVWKVDSRRATGGYWTCSHKDAGDPRPPRKRRADTTPRPRRRRTSTGRSRPTVGTQEWMHNPAVAACKHDGCFWDAPCPVHGRTRPAAPVTDD